MGRLSATWAHARTPPLRPHHSLTWGTSVFMQQNTGETWSEGRMDRASSAARRVCSGVRPEGSEGSSSSPSVAGTRGWHRLSRKERQTHWSWTYWATILPHPWQDDDSSKKLKDPRHHATLPQPSLRVFHMWHTVLTKGTQTLWSACGLSPVKPTWWLLGQQGGGGGMASPRSAGMGQCCSWAGSKLSPLRNWTSDRTWVPTARLPSCSLAHVSVPSWCPPWCGSTGPAATCSSLSGFPVSRASSQDRLRPLPA